MRDMRDQRLHERRLARTGSACNDDVLAISDRLAEERAVIARATKREQLGVLFRDLTGVLDDVVEKSIGLVLIERSRLLGR